MYERSTKTITFSLPLGMLLQVQQIREEEGRAMSEIIRDALRLYIEEREFRRQERLQRMRLRQGPFGAGALEVRSGRVYGNMQGTKAPDTTGAVLVRGVDFTSRPKKRKPILVVECQLDSNVLRLAKNPFRYLENFDEFEEFLAHPSPSGLPAITGIDMPFGLALRFIDNVGWPTEWESYVEEVARLTRDEWRKKLDDYKACRPVGDKEHLRVTDAIAGSLSPQKQFGVPVALMFYEGAPRLVRAGVMIPGLREGCSERVVVEAYPGVLVRNLLGEKPSYKTDTKGKEKSAQLEARRAILNALVNTGPLAPYFIEVQGIEGHEVLVNDATGDHLDALLCAVQAAWAWIRGGPSFGSSVVSTICQTEGWIADPATQQATFGPRFAEGAVSTNAARPTGGISTESLSRGGRNLVS